MSQKEGLKILVVCHHGTGHQAQCVGLCQVLARRDHQITFLVSQVHAGHFSKLGFGEILLQEEKKEEDEKQKDDSSSESAKDPVRKSAEQYIADGYLSERTAFEKMRVHSVGEGNYLQTLAEQLAAVDGQLEAAFRSWQPDLVLLSQFLVPPAVRRLTGALPWVFQWPLNPLALFPVHPLLPPFFSGYSVAKSLEEAAVWAEFQQYQNSEYIGRYEHYQRLLNARCGLEDGRGGPPPLATSGYYAKSPYLNVYALPEELDYLGGDPLVELPENIVRADEFIRSTPGSKEEEGENCKWKAAMKAALELKATDKLIYVSLGSMGSIDVQLMRRLVAVLARTPHKYIVSKGLRAEEYDLPGNCWGEAFLPQTAILPLVDLVITHGGNNTTTETFSYGKPMIVMPLFADQYDNAQRIADKGFGRRLEPYTFKEEELITAIEQLLGDASLQARCTSAARRIQASQSKELVCAQIEQVVAKFRAESHAKEQCK